MPENEPNQTISKRYATPISESQLPLDDDRRIYVDGSGCCSIAFFTQRAEELLDYYLDLMRWLEPNEEIIGAAAWCDPDSLIVTRLEYAPTGVVAWLAGGGDGVRQTVNVQISTSLGKIKLVEFVVQTYGVAEDLAIVNAEGDHVYVGYNEGEPVIPEPEPRLVAYPSSLTFPITIASTGQASLPLVVKNEGDATAFIRHVDMDGPFSQHNAGVYKLDPGAFIDMTVIYKPQTLGDHTGSISIDIGEGLKQVATFTGTAISGNRLITSGNQLIKPGGETYKLKSINWFGAESEIYTPHGLWARNYRDIIDQIAAMGFNSVRIPFSGDVCNETRYPTSGTINFSLNPELADKTSIQVLDTIIGYMNEKGLYVILDHHRRTAGDGADGSPTSEGYTLSNWIASWQFMANRYTGVEFVLGADLHNEPHLLEWNTWAGYAESAGNAVHAIAPHWLIFVEGVATYGSKSYWWGGELSGVRDRPITLSVENRLVYSVHEYGISVGSQPWLAKEGSVPANWPFNLYGVWRQHWGFIFEEGIAPVWIGEVGGKFGVDGAGNVVSDANAQYERQWIYHLQRYMEGYFNGDETSHLGNAQKGVSFAYWSLNPNSGDTGGILQDDWTTEQTFKLRLISMMLSNITPSYLAGLVPIAWDDVTNDSQLVLAQNGQDHAIPLTDFLDAARIRLYEVGEVHLFGMDVDVPARYKGQTWARVPGEDKTIRIAKADDSNIFATGGSDKVTIAKGNLPAVQLNVTGTAESTDLGSKTTSTNGAHTHKSGTQYNADFLGSGGNTYTSYGSNTLDTTSAGDHNHTVELGAHTHNVSGKTENMGSGTELTVTNAYITLAAWYRVS